MTAFQSDALRRRSRIGAPRFDLFGRSFCSSAFLAAQLPLAWAFRPSSLHRHIIGTSNAHFCASLAWRRLLCGIRSFGQGSNTGFLSFLRSCLLCSLGLTFRLPQSTCIACLRSLFSHAGPRRAGGSSEHGICGLRYVFMLPATTWTSI